MPNFIEGFFKIYKASI